jgi:hypothetical protein
MNVRTRVSLGLLAAASLAVGCPKSQSTPDGGGDGGQGPGPDGGQHVDGGSGSDGGGDAGTDAGSSGCVADSDCLSVGMRCAPDGGCTLPASPCNPSEGSDNCSGTVSYCFTEGINTTNNCFCDPLPDGGGLCYLQTPSCVACATQLECGPASQVDNPGYCGAVGTQGNFCLPLDQGGDCPSGFLPGSVDNMNVCVPSCGACPCSGCTSNSGCPLPAVGVCNPNNGACEPPCQVQTDCPNGDVCNVLGKYLDPDLGTLYAAGQCGTPCTDESDCTVYEGDSGVSFYCDADAGSLCRPTGCIHDSECVQPGFPTGSVIGWCDIWDGNVCATSFCRIGENPVGDVAFNDCIAGYTCYLPDGGAPTYLPEPDAGPIHGECLPIPCNEIPGGAHTACSAGQLCCGEGDAGTKCGGADAGECYSAPRPPWCSACDPTNGTYFNSDCADISDGYAGAVGCLTASGIQHNPPSWCGPACNPAQEWTCPAGWLCSAQPAYFSDCTSCATCLDAGQDSNGNPLYQCGCGGLVGCPSVPQALYEGPSCSSCPVGAAAGGCLPAADDAGFNCLCLPDGGGCPPFTFGGQTYPAVCITLSGVNVCAGALDTQCQIGAAADGGASTGGLCTFGYNCTSGHYGCPDAG